MRNIKTDLQNSDILTIQLIIAITLIHSKDAEEEHVIDSKSNNIKSTSYDDANEVVDEFLIHFVHDIKKS